MWPPWPWCCWAGPVAAGGVSGPVSVGRCWLWRLMSRVPLVRVLLPLCGVRIQIRSAAGQPLIKNGSAADEAGDGCGGLGDLGVAVGGVWGVDGLGEAVLEVVVDQVQGD